MVDNIVLIVKNSLLVNCLKEGLKAVKKSERKKINPSRVDLKGSVNIDECFESKYPQESRWDYLIIVSKTDKEKAVFTEVHPAKPDQVEVIGNKKKWLLRVIKEHLSGLKNENCEFIWLATKGVHIPRNAPQYRKLQKTGVKLKSCLELKDLF